MFLNAGKDKKYPYLCRNKYHNCTCIIPQKAYLCNANYIINTYTNTNEPYNFHLHMPCFSNTYCHRLYNNDYHHTSFTQDTKATAEREQNRWPGKKIWLVQALIISYSYMNNLLSKILKLRGIRLFQIKTCIKILL